MSILILSNVHKDVVRLSYFLNKMNITNIHHCETVEEAMTDISDAIKNKIELVLFDTICIQSNRDDVYGQISSLHEWIQVPILLVTPYDKQETIEGAFFAGVFDFILKPIDFSHFKVRLHIALKYNYEIRLRKDQEYNLQQDLLIAKSVQKSALTPSLHLKAIQFDGLYMTSHTLGGDMYCWFKISEDKTSVILYDVMGHGVASSLVTMSVRSLLRGMMTRLKEPELVIKELNRHIHDIFSDEYMDSFLVTAIYLLIDTKKGIVEYVNASHPAGMMFSEDGEMVDLPANTPILGLLPQIKIEKQKLTLNGRQRIILYTDGLQINEQPPSKEHFLPYIKQENAMDLQRFADHHQLKEEQHKDDISIVFITLIGKGDVDHGVFP